MLFPPLHVRPSNPVDDDIAEDLDHAYEHPDDAGIEVAKGDPRLDTDELVSVALARIMIP